MIRLNREFKTWRSASPRVAAKRVRSARGGVELALVGVCILATLTVPALAERSTTQSADLSTPKKALKYFDRLGADPKIDRAELFYAATTEDEKKVAKAFARVDLASARLRKLVSARWNREAGDAMVHALHDVTADDIDSAVEEINGDKATITGKHFQEPLPMVKVNGAWKISLTKVLTETTADYAVEFCNSVVKAIERTEEEIVMDKYANPSLLERAVKRRMKSARGGN